MPTITRSIMPIRIQNKIRLPRSNSIPITSITHTPRRRIKRRGQINSLTNRVPMRHIIPMSRRPQIKRPGLLRSTPTRRPTLRTRHIRRTMPNKTRYNQHSQIQSTRQRSRIMLPMRQPTIRVRLTTLSRIVITAPFHRLLSTIERCNSIIIRRPRPFHPRVMHSFCSSKGPANATGVINLQDMRRATHTAFTTNIHHPPRAINLLPRFISRILHLIKIFIISSSSTP